MLYPDIRPYVQHTLAVEPPHEIHIEECGNPEGLPVVFLHGGPGGGCEPYHRRFFDPERYRIILFDQRGCGKSTPHAELQGNTTQAMVTDMEAIREHLGIERWVIFGGSWGSTLALVYAQTYPEKTLALILRGIFLCRPRDIHWFYQEGASYLFPDYWQDYLAPIAEQDRHDMVSAYYQLLTSDNEVHRMAAAKAWSLWEARTATLRPNPGVIDHFGNPYTALSLARIESHYFMHNAFLAENQLVDNANKLKDIPGVIIHGRYDCVCPVEQAFALAEAWPEARLEVVDAAGHSAAEPGITKALVNATNEFAEKLAAY